ncbi:hypothetical protein F5H01DRAFT_350756 [Linnemannia elongata]|nr:hypothetical protein F5H01DRAFT_350756 [Linnemannia elongata]
MPSHQKMPSDHHCRYCLLFLSSIIYLLLASGSLQVWSCPSQRLTAPASRTARPVIAERIRECLFPIVRPR